MHTRVFVTGASRGIGNAVATFLSGRGFSVVGTSRNPKKSKNASEKEGFPLIKMDVTQPRSVRGGVKEAVDILGGIDVLVNNAGISHLGPFEEMPDDQGRAVMETNFFGIITVIKEAVPVMRQGGGGLIINVSSLAGMVGVPFQSYYCASKYALEGFSESIRMELGPQGIRVVLVQPGDIKTEIAQHHLICDSGSALYGEAYRTVCEVVRGNVAHACPPEEVARVVYRVIKGSHPKMRYPAGSGASFTALLLRMVPQRIREFVLKRYYRLNK
jgi:NAD(P)-dependent dehydrogenase (short-subunit alcohol dehydrogenase family)